MRSTCDHVVLNKWIKHNLNKLKQFCAESGLETFRPKSIEIYLMAIYLNQNALKIVRIKTLASDEIRIITNKLHSKYAEYRLRTWFNPSQSSCFGAWHSAYLLQSLLTWLIAREQIRVLVFDIYFINSDYAFKDNLGQINIYMYLRFAHWLIILNMNWKHDSRIVMN